MICAHLYVLGSTGTKRCEDDRVFQNSIRLSATFGMNNCAAAAYLIREGGAFFQALWSPTSRCSRRFEWRFENHRGGRSFYKACRYSILPSLRLAGNTTDHTVFESYTVQQTAEVEDRIMKAVGTNGKN